MPKPGRRRGPAVSGAVNWDVTAFVGTFAAYILLGFEFEECLRRANIAGALKATRMETRGSPTREEIEDTFCGRSG